MRNELELIKKIEDYLKGELSDAERVDFEAQVANDLQLQEDVKIQQDIIKGIERIISKGMVHHAGKRYWLRRRLFRWGGAGLAIIIITIAALYYTGKIGHFREPYKNGSLPEYNESGKKNWADADRNIEAQLFFINASADTIIETKGGIVLSVPANGFLDENGHVVTGETELIIKEALTPAAIISVGLSSQSGDNLLESGGMFFVDARQDGKALKIDSKNGIYAEIPADSTRAGMQLFHGNRLANGRIDWIDAKPLVHDLVPVDIQSLNFYPPNYLDSLARWGYDTQNKKFTDSLYYSLSATLFYPKEDRASRPVTAPIDTSISTDYKGGHALLSKINRRVDTATLKNNGLPALPSDIPCGIDPANIKAICSNKFQNTLLSTREFEQRLYWLHKLGNNADVDLYVNNLDKPLSDIDAIIAAISPVKLKEIFTRFAAEHAGKINKGSKQFNKLREYYRMKSRLFAKAIAKTQAEFWNRQSQLDQSALSEQDRRQSDSVKRIDQNFSKEFDINLKDAYRQLGYHTDIPTRQTQANVYGTNVVTTGWCNVDRFVPESVTNRTTLDFTDTQTGKRAIIKYLPVSFTVKGSKRYDRVYVYLLPDKLNSFMRLVDTNGKYSEKLNELIKYSLVCVAYSKDKQAFFYSQKDVQPKKYLNIALAAIRENKLEQVLNRLGTNALVVDLQSADAFLLFEIKDQKRQKRNDAIKQLRDKLEKMIYPCSLPSEPVSVPSK